MNWHLPHDPFYLNRHHEREMLRARLKSLEQALSQIIEIADSHPDADKALIQVANLAESALKL